MTAIRWTSASTSVRRAIIAPHKFVARRRRDAGRACSARYRVGGKLNVCSPGAITFVVPLFAGKYYPENFYRDGAACGRHPHEAFMRWLSSPFSSD